MVIARFQFKPGAGDQFCWFATQEIVEMQFEDASEVVEVVKELEDVLVDCTVLVEDQLIVLSGFEA
tara:strand:- start:250 stop:447 length:198 start_codon:yes stop_codon:yes gene_type:complete